MNTNTISTTKALRVVGTFTFTLAMLTVLASILAFLPDHPEFSFFSTYLSDIGDTPGWPQILFNSGTILLAPLRYLCIVLIILRLRSFVSKRKGFEIVVLVMGAITTFGTVVMTAVPFSVAPAVHKSGIGLYFLGIVFLQSVIGTKEIITKEMPRSLAVWSFSVVACFLIFFALFILLETGIVGRNTPVFWEWMCFFSSIGWLLWHSIFLGKDE